MMRKSVNSLVQIFVAIVTVPVVLDPVYEVSSEPLTKITLATEQSTLIPVTVTELTLIPLLRLLPYSKEVVTPSESQATASFCPTAAKNGLVITNGAIA